MSKAETIEDFYLSKLNFIPVNLKKEIGHFNVFPLEAICNLGSQPMEFVRRDYFKITLIIGHKRVHYADKVIDITDQALVFSNPQIPYKMEQLSEKQTGFICIFTDEFFKQYGNIKEYPVFQPGGNTIFNLTDAQVTELTSIYNKMFSELASDYAYKYDVLKNLVFELIHTAMKIQPAKASVTGNSNATARISSMFMELLDRQFPIESNEQRIAFRSPTDFANQLSVHVNHLNRALKESTGKTTSQIISDRLCIEAKALLKHTNWNVSEIAWCLGFEELPNFINFFRKNVTVSPTHFRAA